MENRYVVYAIIAAGIASSIASLMSLRVYLIIFAVSACLLSLFVYKFWDIIEAMFIKKTRIIQRLGDFGLEGERNAAVRRLPDGFSATAAAVLSGTPTKEISREAVERVIANSNSPFRLVVQAEKLDTKKIMDSLKTRRRMKEIELSRARLSERESASAKHKLIEREVEMIEDEIREIGTGAIPIKTSIYLMTTAVSESKFVAEERAAAQIREFSGEFSAIIGAGFEPVHGTELIRILGIDSVIGR